MFNIQNGDERMPHDLFFFLNHAAPTDIYTLPLHAPLPIFDHHRHIGLRLQQLHQDGRVEEDVAVEEEDRKSTRLNSSHSQISYAVFCLKKKIIAGASAPYLSINYI